MENLDLFLEILSIDSSSSREKGLSDFLAERFLTGKNRIERFPVGVTAENPDGDGTENLLFSWGSPKVVFCTHLDTVPPYFPPAVECCKTEDGGEEVVVRGRGACDANGQIIAMFNACLELERRGCTDFGLLLLAGEEAGSLGAKSFAETAVKNGLEADYVIVGEPTDNLMVSACKGTKSFEVTFTGTSCHSGYPEHGMSAVDMFVDFVNALRSVEFPEDPVLGKTTWNIGKLSSANPQNILSPSLGFRIYFRTTFASDGIVTNLMKNMAGGDAKLRFGKIAATDGNSACGKDAAPWQKAMSVKAFGGDTPMEYTVFDGFGTVPAAFGSDAPQLKGFAHRCLCGPGSILVAHTAGEYVKISDLVKASGQYVRMYEQAAAAGTSPEGCRKTNPEANTKTGRGICPETKRKTSHETCPETKLETCPESISKKGL